MRRRLRFFILAIIGIVVVAVSVMAGRAIWRQKQAALLQKGLELLPGVVQRLQNFKRVKLVGDQKVWEVAAEDAQYYEAENMVFVKRAAVQLYLDDGRSIGFEGREGKIYVEGKEVVRVELAGGIEASLDTYQIRADNAVYDQLNNRVSVPGIVHITGDGFELNGEGMEIDVTGKTLRLLHRVSMGLIPSKASLSGGSHAPL